MEPRSGIIFCQKPATRPPDHLNILPEGKTPHVSNFTRCLLGVWLVSRRYLVGVLNFSVCVWRLSFFRVSYKIFIAQKTTAPKYGVEYLPDTFWWCQMYTMTGVVPGKMRETTGYTLHTAVTIVSLVFTKFKPLI